MSDALDNVLRYEPLQRTWPSCAAQPHIHCPNEASGHSKIESR